MKRTVLTMAMVVACAMSNQSFGFDLLDRMLGIKCCGGADTCCDTGCDMGCEPACGCEVASSPCGCAEPACGCEVASPCGMASPCGCASEPACGCEMPTACCDSGCDSGGCCLSGAKKKGCGLLDKLFGKKKSSCDSGCCGVAEPACGCETASCCDNGCDSGGCCLSGGAKKGCGLLSKLFGKKKSSCDSGCCGVAEPACGCEPTCGAPACGCGAAPMAVPTVTPSYQSAPVYNSTPTYDSGTTVEPEIKTDVMPSPVTDPSAHVTRNRRVIQASAYRVR